MTASVAPRPYTVTLYGSGDPPQPVLAFAEALGRRIAERGWLLKNGGYGGTMEAAARGARAAGGRVLGVTCGAFGRAGPNRYLSETRETTDLFGRLAGLVEDANAFGAFMGGTGTLTEVFLTWELMVKGLLPARPLCLLGPEWAPWWELVRTQPALAAQMSLLSRAVDADEAVEQLARGGSAA